MICANPVSTVRSMGLCDQMSSWNRRERRSRSRVICTWLHLIAWPKIAQPPVLGERLRHKRHAISGIGVTCDAPFSPSISSSKQLSMSLTLTCDASVIGRFVFVRVMKRLSRVLSKTMEMSCMRSWGGNAAQLSGERQRRFRPIDAWV
jgi:hypothetical protein